MASDTAYPDRSSDAISWLDGWTLDGVVAVLSFLLMAGVAMDFRAHAHGISFEEEGFLTPEHTFFYSMFLGIAAVLFVATYRNRRAGATWASAVPDGYGWAVVGVLLFGVAGVGDFGWHSAFGFETGVEALTSPSHLGLATGAGLFLSSPLRAAWRRNERERLEGVAFVPVVLSAALMLTVFALFTTYVNPLINVFPTSAEWSSRNLGLASMLLFPVLLVGTGLTLVRRFDAPFGALAVTFLFPALASTVINDHFVLVVPAVVAGVTGDAISRRARPTDENPLALRGFGALVPATFAAAYFAVIEAVWGVAWTVHVWTGAVALAGLAGLLLTYAVLPDGTREVSA